MKKLLICPAIMTVVVLATFFIMFDDPDNARFALGYSLGVAFIMPVIVVLTVTVAFPAVLSAAVVVALSITLTIATTPVAHTLSNNYFIAFIIFILAFVFVYYFVTKAYNFNISEKVIWVSSSAIQFVIVFIPMFVACH